ncbi:MAG: hypothetical protein ABI970_00030 [Chloroflexota bacterium]
MKKSNLKNRSLIVILFTSLFLLVGNSQAQDNLPLINATNLMGKIAVVLNGKLDIVELKTATQTLLELNDNWIHIDEPRWSPTEARIVFAALYFAKPEDSYPISDIFVVNDDGSGLIQLTKNMGTNSNPRWTSDGQRIMFKSTQAATSEILISDLNGKILTKLANFEAKDWDFWSLDLSPSGDKLAFVNNRGYRVLQPDGTNFTKSSRVSVAKVDNGRVSKIVDITKGDDCGAGDFYWDTAWSPDGNYLAVSFGCAPDLGEIYLVDSANIEKLTSIYDAVKLMPEQNRNRIIDGLGWSSDGKHIVFVDSTSDDNGKTYKNLYAVGVDQGEQNSLITITSNKDAYIQLVSPSWVQ